MARIGFSTAAATDTALIAAQGAGKCIRVLRLMFTTSIAATVSFSNGTNGTTTQFITGDFGANGGGVWESTGLPGALMPVAVLSPNTALNLTNSAGTAKGVIEWDLLG